MKGQAMSMPSPASATHTSSVRSQIPTYFTPCRALPVASAPQPNTHALRRAAVPSQTRT